MEFDPRAVNSYTFEQLQGFINTGVVTFAQLQSMGLNWQMQEQIKNWLAAIEKKKQEADTDFKAACSINTSQSYDFFISKYGKTSPKACAPIGAATPPPWVRWLCK